MGSSPPLAQGARTTRTVLGVENSRKTDRRTETLNLSSILPYSQ